ncbi:hypothetical protein AZE42_11808, partial [Rhizopogon vesiculosus]
SWTTFSTGLRVVVEQVTAELLETGTGDDRHEIDTINAPEVLVLVLEVLNEVVHEAVVKVLTTQVGVIGGSLDLEDTLLNVQEENIEGSSTEIENEDIVLAVDLVKTRHLTISLWFFS